MDPFLRDLNASYHGSGIAHKSRLNQKTVANTLNSLEGEGLLRSRIVGKNKEFRLCFDDREKVMRFLLSLENARSARFLDEHPRIKEFVAKTKPHFRGIVVVFGSYAKETQKKDSDLDLLSVGEYDAKQVGEVAELYGIHVSVKNMRLKDFIQALREKDLFINEVVSGHMIIRGIESYLENVVREYYGR
ncbi:MAG: nucleotidyltransferase domain-containing protein [Candidatus Altiarchaeota archaeon]